MTEQSSPDDYMLVGQIVGAFGIRGQIKLRSLTDNVDHLRRQIKALYIGPKRQEFKLKEAFEHKPGMLILTLEGVSSRIAAEELRGSEVTILEHQAAPLAVDEYFIHQLFGLEVRTEDGAVMGTVREVLQTGANDVLVVAREGKPEALLPIIHDVILSFNFAEKYVVVRPLEGLLSD